MAKSGSFRVGAGSGSRLENKRQEFVNLYRKVWGSNSGLSTDEINVMSEARLDESIRSLKMMDNLNMKSSEPRILRPDGTNRVIVGFHGKEYMVEIEPVREGGVVSVARVGSQADGFFAQGDEQAREVFGPKWDSFTEFDATDVIKILNSAGALPK